MHLKRLRVSNFRSLEEIDVEFDSLVSVIIGPNAIGKTTILEAIRLAKAVLSPRTPNEANQTLNSLGITSPHIPQGMFPAAVTSNSNKLTEIGAVFKMEAEEVQNVRNLLPKLVPILAQQSIGINFGTHAQAMAFFASDQGKVAMKLANDQLEKACNLIENTSTLILNLTINFLSNTIGGSHPIHQLIFAALEQALPPTKSLFSYFPADRAMPIGEQPVQLGAADTNNQLESYNSQPQVKYHRLKHTIFNAIIRSGEGRDDLTQNFKLIFDRILKGRALGEIGINQIGMLSIPIIDVETGVQFDIDGLSSGEKGLILTFLLISQSIERNGLILLDEPELHLNPAVCRDLLQFLVDEYAIKKNMQAIVCSHSAEILAGAFDRQDCALFHLRSGTSLAKVRQNDRGEIRDALRRLGSSESEALLYKGTVSVEGIHDVEVLQTGFDDILRRYRLRERGGRGQVEKDISELQRAELNGDEIGSHFFVFDHDGKPNRIKDSQKVKLLQLERFCIENYLLDIEIITDLTREREFAEDPLANVTQTRDIMKRLALSQLSEIAARAAFRELGLETVAFDMSVLCQEGSLKIAAGISEKIGEIITTLTGLQNEDFSARFTLLWEAKIQELRLLWDDKWRELCNGKRLLEDMRKDGHLRGDILRLKRRIIGEMKNKKTEAWRSLDSLIRNLLGSE